MIRNRTGPPVGADGPEGGKKITALQPYATSLPKRKFSPDALSEREGRR
jgi:hypothetical protein